MKGKRTGIDFSKHQLNIKSATFPDTNERVLIHELKKPNTVMESIKFINTQGIMTVTGDFGNWVFCREFHPSAKGYVSGSYWLEKLRTASDQTGVEFDPEGTKERINEMLSELEEEKEDYSEKDFQEVKEYLEGCLDHVGLSEFEYTSFAYNEYPNNWDCENVPFCKKPQNWMEIIFDAFDEICRRFSKLIEQ